MHIILDSGANSQALFLVRLGNMLWLGAFLLILWESTRTRALSMPAAMVIMNLPWLIVFAVICPTAKGVPLCYRIADLDQWYLRILLIVELALLVQVLRCSPSSTLPFPKFRFRLTVTRLLALSLAIQYSYVRLALDVNGVNSSLIITFLVSFLFAWTALSQPQTPAIQRLAWLKLLGNSSAMLGILARPIEKVVSFRFASDLDFVYLLFFLTFLFDMIYLVLSHGRNGPATQPLTDPLGSTVR